MSWRKPPEAVGRRDKHESTDNEADRHGADRDRTGGSVLHDRHHEQPWRSDGTGFCERSNLVCGDVRRGAFERKG